MNYGNDSHLFPPIEPYRSGRLQVDEIHNLYWEESGNPAGQPVLFLHGGPGSGTASRHRQFFDPAWESVLPEIASGEAMIRMRRTRRSCSWRNSSGWAR